MLGARLGRRQAGLGRLASLRPLGWQVDALDRRLEDGGALLAATALADGGPLPPPPPPRPSSSGVRLASAWAGGSLTDRSSSSLSSTLFSRTESNSSGCAWQAIGGPAMLPVCSSPTSRLHQAAAGWRRGFASSSGSDGTNSVSSSSGEQLVLVAHRDKRCKPVTLRPELASELAQLAALCGVKDRAALAAKVAVQGLKPEQRVLQHGGQVAAHLQQLGVPQLQLGRLLLRCPLLFSWPAEERAGPLFEQLMGRLGLTVEQAGRCFQQQPNAAGSKVDSFAQSIEALAELFAAASRANGGGAAGSSSGAAALSEAEQRAGEQQLGQLLRGTPAAVALLQLAADTLRQRCEALQQRYSLIAKQLVSALKMNPQLLARDPKGHFMEVEAALEEELGVEGRQLVGAMLQGGAARAVGCSVETLRQRARALLEMFTRQQLQTLELGSLAFLLAVDTATWQLALAVWRALGVADPAALAFENTRPLALNWLEPGRLANLLALQRSLGLSSPGAVVQQQGFAGYSANSAPERLAGRLLFLQQEGLLPLLVVREQPGPPTKGKPPRISVRDVAVESDAVFCSLPALPRDAADRYAAFMARLEAHPPYQQLRAEAVAWAEQLKAEHPEVARLAAAGRAPAKAAGRAARAAAAEGDEAAA